MTNKFINMKQDIIMSKLYVIPFLLMFLFLIVPNVNASKIWSDDFTRDVFTPWINYGSGISISSINGYVDFRNYNDGGMNRTFPNSLTDFNYSFDSISPTIYEVFYNEIKFKDESGAILQFRIDEYLGSWVLKISYNGTQYNSSSITPNYTSWKSVNITRIGNFVKFIYDGYSVSYNLPIQYPVSSIDHHILMSVDYQITQIDNSYLYGYISLPANNYTWTVDTSCTSESVPTGSSVICVPDSFQVNNKCIEGSVSAWIKSEILGYPLETCSGTMRLKGYIPSTNLTIDQNYTECIDKTTIYGYYYNYLAGDTVSGYGQASVSQLCDCWSIFTLYARLHAECQYGLNQKIVDFGNGTIKPIYCDNGETRWCNGNYFTYLDLDCTQISKYCQYGCDPSLNDCMTFNQTITNPTQPTDITGFLNTGTRMFMSPITIWTIILFVLAFGSEMMLAKNGVKTGGKIIAVIMVIGVTLLAIFGIYPQWLLIIEFVLVALIIGIFIRKKGGE